MFGNRQRYPRFYRLVPEAREFSDGYVAIVKYLNWQRVAVVYYSDEFTLDVSCIDKGLNRSSISHCSLAYTLYEPLKTVE